MRKVLYVILAILIGLTSCQDRNKKEITNQDIKVSNETINRLTEQDNSITLILLNTLLGSNDEMMGEYMTQLLNEVGFDIDIKFFKFNYINYTGSLKDYQNYIREEINSGKNVIFETEGDMNELMSENLLYNFGTDEEGYFLALGSQKRYSYTGVFINNELEIKYGKPINNTSDYESYLKWVAKVDNKMIPGLIVMDSFTGEFYSPLALFAQENGYVRADYAIGNFSQSGTTMYIDLEDIKHIDEYTPILYQAVELPFFKDMEEKLVSWSNNGYIEFKEKSEILRLDSFASLILNTEDATEFYSYRYQSMQWRLLDVSDFNLHIFTKDGMLIDTPMVYNSEASSKFAVSSKSPSPYVLKSFIDWIYSSQENYQYFMCGKEGTDYALNNGRFNFHANNLNINYGLWHKHTQFIDYNFDLFMPHFPANWIEFNNSLSQVNYTSIVNEIGYENIEFDISELLKDTVADTGLELAYKLEAKPKYDKFFDNITNGAREYGHLDLLYDIRRSSAAETKKKAYEELLNALCGKR